MDREGEHMPEVQLMHDFTNEQIFILPSPDGPFSDAFSVYRQIVQRIRQFMRGV